MSSVDVVITTSALDDDPNGIAEDQTTVGAGDLTLNGALVSSGTATMAEAQIVSIESTGNLSAITFTVTGTDADGTIISEDVTGPNAATVTSAAYFKTVTQIAVDAAVGTNVEVGVAASNGMVTRSVTTSWWHAPFNVSLSVELVTDTGTFGAQYTVDKPDGSYATSFATDANWRDAQGLDPDTNTATGDDNIVVPVRAVRGKVTTATATGVYKFTFLQGAPTR